MSKDLCAECFKIFNEDPSFYTRKYSASENSSSVRVSSKYSSVCCIKVDKNKNKKRCDYIFVINSVKNKLFLFVELKGGSENGEYAVKQLIETIDFFKDKYNAPSKGDRIVGLVVGGRATIKMIKAKEIFKKKYGGELIHKSGHKQSYEYS